MDRPLLGAAVLRPAGHRGMAGASAAASVGAGVGMALVGAAISSRHSRGGVDFVISDDLGMVLIMAVFITILIMVSTGAISPTPATTFFITTHSPATTLVDGLQPVGSMEAAAMGGRVNSAMPTTRARASWLPARTRGCAALQAAPGIQHGARVSQDTITHSPARPEMVAVGLPVVQAR